MFDITDEITYTPGRLAKKLGISKSKLMRHLRATKLIEQCRLTQSGHWQIPYSVAVRISSAEALSLKTEGRGEKKAGGDKVPKSRQTVSSSYMSPSAQPKVSNYTQPNYAQIGKTLRRAGVTMIDLIRYFEQGVDGSGTQATQPKPQGFDIGLDTPGESGALPRLSALDPKQTEVTHEPSQNNEKWQNNSAKRDENQTVSESTSGSASSDISNSSEK